VKRKLKKTGSSINKEKNMLTKFIKAAVEVTPDSVRVMMSKVKEKVQNFVLTNQMQY
jgi:hypothetical protein